MDVTHLTPGHLDGAFLTLGILNLGRVQPLRLPSALVCQTHWCIDQVHVVGTHEDELPGDVKEMGNGLRMWQHLTAQYAAFHIPLALL